MIKSVKWKTTWTTNDVEIIKILATNDDEIEINPIYHRQWFPSWI